MIAESSTVFGRPGRGSSSNPANPCSANRSRHLITVGRDTPSSRAVPEVPFPSATANTIRARSTWLARIERDRVHDSNVARSSLTDHQRRSVHAPFSSTNTCKSINDAQH